MSSATPIDPMPKKKWGIFRILLVTTVVGAVGFYLADESTKFAFVKGAGEVFLGDDHPITLLAATALATSIMVKNPDEGINHLKVILSRLENRFGVESFQKYGCLVVIATLLNDRGKLEEAQDYFERCLSYFESKNNKVSIAATRDVMKLLIKNLEKQNKLIEAADLKERLDRYNSRAESE